jgi:hypothetical protein
VGDTQQSVNEAQALQLDLMQCQTDTAPTHAMQGCGKRGLRKEHRNDFDGTQEELIPVNVTSWRNAEGAVIKKAHFGGVLKCNSNTGFCDCPNQNAREHRRKLLRMMRRWIWQGNHLYFMTLTMSHAVSHNLQELEEARQAGMYSVTNDYRWKSKKQSFGIAGRVTMIEATKGPSGWHPHVHMVLFVDREWDENEQNDFGDRTFERWSDGVMERGKAIYEMKPPSKRRGIDIEHITAERRLQDIADYAVKNQLVSAALEMTNSEGKEGRSDGEAIKEIRRRHYEAWLAHGRYRRHLNAQDKVVMEGSGAGRNFFIDSPRVGDLVTRQELERYRQSYEKRRDLLEAPSWPEPIIPAADDDDLDIGRLDRGLSEWGAYRASLKAFNQELDDVAPFLGDDPRQVYVDDDNFFFEGARIARPLYVPDESKDYFEYCLTYQGMPMISTEYGVKNPQTELERAWFHLLDYGDREVKSWTDLPEVMQDYADSHEGYFDEDDDAFRRGSNGEAGVVGMAVCEYIDTVTPVYILHTSFRKKLNGRLDRQRMLLEAIVISVDAFANVANELGVDYLTAQEIRWVLYERGDDDDRRVPSNQGDIGRFIRRSMPAVIRKRQDLLLRATNRVYQGLTPERDDGGVDECGTKRKNGPRRQKIDRNLVEVTRPPVAPASLRSGRAA